MKPVDENKLITRAQRLLKALKAVVITTIVLVVIILVCALSLSQSGLLEEDSPAWGANLLVALCIIAIVVVAGLFVCGVWAAIMASRLHKVQVEKAKRARVPLSYREPEDEVPDEHSASAEAAAPEQDKSPAPAEEGEPQAKVGQTDDKPSGDVPADPGVDGADR
ncbi:MAG: hypothetical protein LUD50_07105 [Clostridia bacterium]|nr:hypothetical protein [Clostridia bacterium]